MKITRLVHSCLLIQEGDTNVLIDPGSYSLADAYEQIKDLPRIDYILISHIHEDHCSIEFIKHVLENSPEAKIISNEEVVGHLKLSGIDSTTQTPDFIEATNLDHPKLALGKPPVNTVFSLWRKLTHFGDNRELSKVNLADTVTFPITAPWGSLVDAVDHLNTNPPKQIIPIHDWHLSDDGRSYYYDTLEHALTETKFIRLEPTATIDM